MLTFVGNSRYCRTILLTIKQNIPILARQITLQNNLALRDPAEARVPRPWAEVLPAKLPKIFLIASFRAILIFVIVVMSSKISFNLGQ